MICELFSDFGIQTNAKVPPLGKSSGADKPDVKDDDFSILPVES